MKRAAVFGSFLSEKDQLNDIDLAIELEAKEKNPKRHMALCESRIKEVRGSRRFSNVVEEYAWPQVEVQRRLKRGMRGLSLHEWAELGMLQTEYREVWHV